MDTTIDLLKAICWYWDITGAGAKQKLLLSKTTIDEISKALLVETGSNIIEIDGYIIEFIERRK